MIADRLFLYIASGVAAAALLGVAVQTQRLHAVQIALSAEQLARQTDSTHAAQATADAVARALALHQTRTNEIQGIADEALAQAARDRDDAAAAGRAAVGLRQRAAALAASCGGQGRDSTATPGSPAATGPGMVLADVLGRADDTAGELAEAYDRARTAGLACERYADALKKVP